jgi:hypothetical protein
VEVSQVEVGLVAASLALEAPEAITLGNTRPVAQGPDGRWVVGDGEAVVQDAADRIERDPQLAHLRLYPEIDGFVYEGVPIRVDGERLPIRGPAPALGADTEEVLAEWLSPS